MSINKYKDITGEKVGNVYRAIRFDERRNGYSYWILRCKCGLDVSKQPSEVKKYPNATCGYCPEESKDIQGKRFGSLTAEKFIGTPNKRNFWVFRCDCGLTTNRYRSEVVSGNVSTCGCRSVRDWTGHDFGKMKVLEKSEKKSRDGRLLWRVVCGCGNISLRKDSDLRRYHKYSSCGCFKSDWFSILKSGDEEYRAKKYLKLNYIWKRMRRSCNNRNHPKFKDYGGRGISVCEEWDNSFPAFAKWAVENGYEEGLTSIDRIDNNGNYSPDNCRWTNYTIQAQNQRIKSSNKSGLKGIRWDTQYGGGWIVSIGHCGKNVYFGKYKNLEEAKEKRRSAEIEYWGHNVDDVGIIDKNTI